MPKYRSKNANKVPNGALALTIDQFCAMIPISRATYHNLKRAGQGPREMQIGRVHRRISMDAAKAWIKDRERRATPLPSSETR
jgi:hypothetical protein